MCIRANAKRAFTLLEVMIAVAIVGLMTISVYRFVVAHLTAIRVTTQVAEERAAVIALVNLIEAEMQDLPPRSNNVILGTPHKFNNLPSDELEWTCQAGNGLLTKAAKGEWRATLAIQPPERTSRELEIGLRRRPIDAKPSDYRWLPLLKNMTALEIRYLDGRVNQWVERWQDGSARPSLIRVRIWRTKEDPPYEAIIAVPSANLQV